MKRLIRKAADLDVYNRDAAIAYINGKVFSANTHGQCVGIYLDSVNSDEDLYNYWMRPSAEQLEQVDVDRVAFAHLLEKTKEIDYNGDIVLQPGIYVESNTLTNVSMDEVKNAIKQAYPQYDIFEIDGDINSSDEVKKVAMMLRKRRKIGLKRLLRSAGLGRGYFSPGDVNIQVGDFEFLITVTNEDKLVHEDEGYEGAYVDLHSKNDIGGAEFNIIENGSDDFEELMNRDDFSQYDIIIDIMRVELRPEYRGTGVIWMGFDAWIDQVLMKYVNTYGLYKVCIVSTFENYEFSKSLPMYIRSKVNVEFKAYY